MHAGSPTQRAINRSDHEILSGKRNRTILRAPNVSVRSPEPIAPTWSLGVNTCAREVHCPDSKPTRLQKRDHLSPSGRRTNTNAGRVLDIRFFSANSNGLPAQVESSRRKTTRVLTMMLASPQLAT